MSRNSLILSVAALVGSAALLVQTGHSQPTADAATQPATRPAGERVARPLIEPTQAADDGWGRPHSPLLRREGDFVVKRRGRVVPADEGRHHLFVFDSQSDRPASAMVLLPNRKLEEVELLLRQGDRPLIVSGQITLYRGTNYLMVTSYAEEAPATQPRD